MKKIIAIFFLGIYLHNLVGNSLLIDLMIGRNQVQAVDRIDAGEFERSDLVEMKVPISFSYYSSTPGYERYYGAMKKDGVSYHYVMRKVINDTVYLLCLPDEIQDQLSQAKMEARLQAADQQGEGKSDHNRGNNSKKQPGIDMFRLPDPVEYSFLITDDLSLNEDLSLRISCSCIEPPFRPPVVKA